jgi:hypothetical protein
MKQKQSDIMISITGVCSGITGITYTIIDIYVNGYPSLIAGILAVVGIATIIANSYFLSDTLMQCD